MRTELFDDPEDQTLEIDPRSGEGPAEPDPLKVGRDEGHGMAGERAPAEPSDRADDRS
jgi:hypothetical protein